jgi:hypothetical protein
MGGKFGYGGGMNGSLRLLMYVLLVAAAGDAVAQSVKADGEKPALKGVADSTRSGTVAVAPTAEEAERAYQNARQSFMAVASGAADVSVTEPKVVVMEDTIAGGQPQNVAMEQVRIVMDVDNVTLREVMQKIVEQAATYTGPWTVKWRLRPENMALMDERVNLTAEADFGEFCTLLTEKVKNMTGAQLFVTAFASSRVLMVADTYY